MHAIGRLLVPACLLVVALFVALAFCSYPVADDFIFASRSAGRDFLSVQTFWYREWSGKYFGTFCVSGFLAVFGLIEAYWLAPTLLIGMTWAALRLAVGSFSGGRLRHGDALLASLVLIALFLAGVRGPSESVFWLTAAYEYQIASIGAVLLIALLVMRPRSTAARIANTIAVTLAAFCAVGGTETMMVAMVLTVISWWGVTLLVAPRRPTARQAFVSAAILAGAALMIACPGNEVRSSHFPDARQLGPTLVQATGRGLLSVGKWSLNPALLGVSLLFLRHAPLLARNGIRRVMRLRMSNPLPAVWLIGIVIACMTPSFWAIGFKPPKRAEGNIWIVFLLGWFAFVLPFAWAVLRNRGAFWRGAGVARLGRALVVVGLFVPGNVPYALYDVFGLGAFRYHRAQVQRTAEVNAEKARGTAKVVTRFIEHRPKSIWVDDITGDATDWRNAWFASYFGVESVIAVPVAAGEIRK